MSEFAIELLRVLDEPALGGEVDRDLAAADRGTREVRPRQAGVLGGGVQDDAGRSHPDQLD